MLTIDFLYSKYEILLKEYCSYYKIKSDIDFKNIDPDSYGKYANDAHSKRDLHTILLIIDKSKTNITDISIGDILILNELYDKYTGRNNV